MSQEVRKQIYKSVITEIFRQHYRPGTETFEFTREEIKEVGNRLGLEPNNRGDLIYKYRFRSPLPKEIVDTNRKDDSG